MKRLVPMLALAWVVRAGAGEPLATDDASIVEKGVCQFESWHRWEDNGGHEGWGVPACSVHDALELGIGGASYRNEERGKHAKLLLQAKSVFWRDPGERWSVGAVAIAVRDYGRDEHSGFHELAALGLLSFNHPNDTTRVHVNAGAVKSRGEFSTFAWGTAIEYDFAESWTLLGEVYRDSPGRPFYQAGIRFTLVQDRVELFASGGDRIGGARGEWFAKFGVRFQSWKLF